jgi:hypothetical protein
MEHCTKKAGEEKEVPAWSANTIEARMRTRIRETIEAVVEEELETALGAARSARAARHDRAIGMARESGG